MCEHERTLAAAIANCTNGGVGGDDAPDTADEDDRRTAAFGVTQLLQRWRYKVFDLMMEKTRQSRRLDAADERTLALTTSLRSQLTAHEDTILILRRQAHDAATDLSQQVIECNEFESCIGGTV